MILHAGFQTLEFLQALELPKPLAFSSPDDALNWLKHVASQHPDLTSRFREYLTRYSDDPQIPQLSDHQAFERLALLLHSRRIVAIARETRSGAGTPSPAAATPPAFPLSQRTARAPSSASSPPPAINDPATFNSNIDAAAQADALVAAAADGKPFCPE